jgi:hypothetical protein
MGMEADTARPPADTDSPPPSTDGRSDSQEQREAAFRYFSDLLVGAAAKQPREEWKESRERYEGDPSDSELVGWWRVHVDTQAAFLRSEPAKLRFTVPTAHSDDKVSKMRTDCEQAEYDYIAREEGFEDVLDQMSHSADLTNVGFVCVVPDVDKWLPKLKFLRNEQVAIDGTVGPRIEDAGWVAYSELESPDELHSRFPEVPLSTFQLAASKQGLHSTGTGDSIEAKEAADRLDENPRGGLSQCRTWRIFARRSYAMYDRIPNERGGKEDDKTMRPDAKYRTPGGEARRFLFLVEGMSVPLTDKMEWPRMLLLDKGEWPIERLMYNRSVDSMYGFPDYRHERDLLSEITRAVTDMAAKASLEGLKLGTNATSNIPEEALKTLLETPGIQVLDGIFDAQGNPLVHVLELPGLAPEDITWLTTLIQLYDQQSMQPRSTRGDEDPRKSATATQVETDMATGRANKRLHTFEATLAKIAKKVMQMAHAMLPVLTQIEMEGEAELAELPYAEAEIALELPGTRLKRLGVEAIAGDNAAAWLAMPEGDPEGFISVLLRSVRVSVEQGSTQRFVRVQKAAQFEKFLVETVIPTATTLGDMTPVIEGMKKLLPMQGLEEFESITDAFEVAIANQQAMQQAMAQQQAAEQAAAGGGLQPGTPTADQIGGDLIDPQAGVDHVAAQPQMEAPVA